MFFLKRENGCRNIFMTKSPRKKNAGRMVDVGSDCTGNRLRPRYGAYMYAPVFFFFFFFFFLLHVLGIYMCTELVPVLHTRENFVPDLHMCDEYLTNSSHVRSYLLEKFEHNSHLQCIEIYQL